MSVDSYTGSSDPAVYIYHHQKIVHGNKWCFGQVLEMKHLHLLYVLILVVMGDFKGHVLPGVFLITLGIWWTTKCVLKYAFKNQKQTSYFDPKALFCRMEMLEGIVLVGMALIGEWSFSVFCLLSWCIFTCKEKTEYQNKRLLKQIFYSNTSEYVF